MDGGLFVYDDGCGFCTWWAQFVAARSAVPVVGFSDLDVATRERLPEDFERCSHLVTTDRVYSCGASVEAALLRTDLGEPVRPVVRSLRRFDTYERCYRVAAANRSLLGRVLSTTPPVKRDVRDVNVEE